MINRQSNSSAEIIYDNNKLITDTEEICNTFNNYFASVCSLDESKFDPPPFEYKTDSRLEHITITPAEISKSINAQKVGKATGPDLISNQLLKEINDSLALPFCQFVNYSIDHSIYPPDWLLYNVLALHKKDDRTLKENYRPIALLSCLSKIAERCIANHLQHYLITNNILTERQSGFIPGDSTANQLLYITNSINKSFDEGSDAIGIFMDISKAFDRVSHKALMFKLKQIGITGRLLKWFKSYLSNRKQRVIINGSISKTQKVNAGVPQGSVLGPILFLIFINDIVEQVQNDIRLFADDTFLFRVCTNIQTAVQSLNDDLKQIATWAKTWLVEFNPNKCYVMHFTTKQKPEVLPDIHFQDRILTVLLKHKHLGVFLTPNLSWTAHIDYIISKGSKRLGQIAQLKNKLSRKTINTLYLSLVRPILEYSCIIFTNLTQRDANRLEILQNKAARFVTGAITGTNNSRLLKEVGWDSLHDRRISYLMTLMFKTTAGLGPTYLGEILINMTYIQAQYNLRNPQLALVQAHTSRYRNCPLPLAIRCWNNLPIALRASQTVDQFKRNYKREYLSRPITLNNYGTKRENKLLSRFRMNFPTLNSYLFGRQLVLNSACDCGNRNETMYHYFNICPLYAAPREELLRDITDILRPYGIPLPNRTLLVQNLTTGFDDLNPRDNRLILRATLRFIDSSGRFEVN